MSKAKARNSTNLPTTRPAIEALIDNLIDKLNAMDGDPDAEPSLGWTAGYRPEDYPQDGPCFFMNANGGNDHEDEHDGAEPDETDEDLGSTDALDQSSGAFWGGGFAAGHREVGVVSAE